MTTSTIRFAVETETAESCEVAIKRAGYYLRDDCGDVHGPFTSERDAIDCAADLLYLTLVDTLPLWNASKAQAQTKPIADLNRT
jgi:hypothetical protein